MKSVKMKKLKLQDILRRRLALAGHHPDFGDIIASLDTSSSNNAPKIQSFDSPLQESLDICRKLLFIRADKTIFAIVC